jgi:hypothetical protein
MEHRWKQWVAENKIVGLPDDVITSTLTRNGVDLQRAAEEVAAAASHPYIHAAANLIQLAKKLESILAVQRQLAELSPQAGQIERRESVDAATFLRQYYCTNTPVLLTGMMKGWKALERWTPEYLRERLGQTLVEVQVGRDSDPDYERNLDQHRKSMPFAEYADRVMAAGVTNDFYMVANNKNVEKTAVATLLDELIQFPGLMDASAWAGRVFLWFGPAGTLTPIHHDPMNVILCQVRGQKRVRLWAPNQTPLLYNYVGVFSEVNAEKPDLQRYPLYAQARPMEFLLEPGEALFIPVGWWHTVKALDVSVSVSMTNFAFPNTFEWMNPHLVR